MKRFEVGGLILLWALFPSLEATQGRSRPKGGAPMSLVETVETIRPSIVQIGYIIKDLPPQVAADIGRAWATGSFGTGFFVNEDGYVITALHVITQGRTTLQNIQAGSKRMVVQLAFPNIKEGGISIRGSFVDVGFEVIDEDARHDLALLKLNRNPFKEKMGTLLQVGDKDIAPLHVGVAILDPGRPRDGVALAASGYPLGQPVLITNAGYMASSWSYDTRELPVPGAPAWFMFPDTADVYLIDLAANPGNSGGPVYLAESGAVIGVLVANKGAPVFDQNGQNISLNGHNLLSKAHLAAVVPSEYVVALLGKYNLKWTGRQKK